MGRRILVVIGLVATLVAAFLGGRASVHRSHAAATVPRSFAAGREAAFSGFDGGWAYGAPYIVTLRRGGPGVTYRFARRWTMVPGTEYRICGRGICTRAAR